MQWNEIQKTWDTQKKEFMAKWPKLTDADLTAIAGKRDELVQKLHGYYKTEKPQLEKDIEAFTRTLVARV